MTTAKRTTSWTKRLLTGASLLALTAALGVGAGSVSFSTTASADVLEMTAPVQGGPDFADLVEKVRPAVVSVRVKVEDRGDVAMNFGDGQSPFGDQNPFDGTPFEKFFKKFGNKKGDQGNQKDGNKGQRHGPMAQSQGSGFFISGDGYIVTNNHVVDGAVEVEVLTDDDKTLSAKVIGTDPKTDLALIKVETTNHGYLKLATKKPRIGEWVVAVGNPFGLASTVTAGIVSAMGRDIGSGPYDDFIQIDAPVNKGNSGGPTFNLSGEVIGVNTAIFSPSGGSVGIAFDIPSTTVATVIPQLKEGGKVSRAWLGVQIQPVTEEIADSIGLKVAKGALIAQPQEDSPGAKAGLKAGDVITAVDGNEVADARDLARKIGGMKPGVSAKLSVFRDGKTEAMDITLGELKDGKVEKASIKPEKGEQLGALGLELAPAGSVDGAGDAGVAVTSVDPGGKGADLGFATGDVILKVGGKAINSSTELKTAMDDLKTSGKKSALFLVKRNDEQRFVLVPVSAG
jgi:serine protease Do